MNSEIFWNRAVLAPPERHAYKLCDVKPRYTVQKLLDICNEIKESVNGLGSLNVEGAALSRLIYRIKGRLRCDKGLQSMLKVNRCLVQYLNLNILNELKVIQEPLSDDIGPSKQMLQWFLVRLQGLAKLFHRTYKTCLEAAEYWTLRMKTGHLWSVALIALATISRIWTVSQYMVQSVCGWYVDLYRCLDKLKPSPQQWLPEDYILPRDLIKFLGEPLFFVKRQSGLKDSDVLSRLTQNPEEEGLSQNDIFNSVIGVTEDMGEFISRDQINNLEKYQYIGKRKANNFEEDFNYTDVHNVGVPRKKKKETSLYPQEYGEVIERIFAPIESNEEKYKVVNEKKLQKNKSANKPKQNTNSNIKEVKSQQKVSHIEKEESVENVATSKKRKRKKRKKKSINIQ